MRDWKGQADMKWLNQSVYAHSWCENVGTSAKFSPPSTQKLGCGDGCGVWIPISTMSNHSTYSWWKDWKGWDAVNCLNQSVHTQSGYKKWVWAKPNLYPLMTRKWFVVTVLDPIHQSQPCLTIHYTYIMRDWIGWADMKWLNQSAHTQNWCETYGDPS